MAAYIAGVTFHLPSQRLTNEQLQDENPDWDIERVVSKVGIKTRHIVAGEECASDLAFAAASKLIEGLRIDRATVDCLLLCTQSPDYVLPTTACVLQDRLGLPTTCAALDFNQGCSGYIYGLYLAKGLLASGLARNVLLLTAETYSKYIHPRDRSVRILFGDAATATLVNCDPKGAAIGEIALGTDGSGYRNLIVPAGGSRTPTNAETRREITDEQGCVRTSEHLFMEGRELFDFTLRRIPEVINTLLTKTGYAHEDVDWFVFHQANAFMNEHLRAKLRIPKEKTPICLEYFGNTVSNTIPITLCEAGARFEIGDKVMLVGFGVGYSWGACLLEWKDVSIV